MVKLLISFIRNIANQNNRVPEIWYPNSVIKVSVFKNYENILIKCRSFVNTCNICSPIKVYIVITCNTCSQIYVKVCIVITYMMCSPITFVKMLIISITFGVFCFTCKLKELPWNDIIKNQYWLHWKYL